MNIKIDMGEILVKAWKITWKFKILWIFGILAGCASNSSGNINFNNGYRSSTGNLPSGNIPNLPDPFKQFQDMQPAQALSAFLGQYLAIIAVVVVLLCVLWLVVYLLGLIGKTGLTKGVGKADAGAEKLSFGELWTESLPYLGRMFWLSVLVALPFFIIIVVLLVILLVAAFGMVGSRGAGSPELATLFGALAIFISAFCCLAILRLVVNMIVEQAQNTIILEDKGVLEALGRGWNIFKASFLTIILMAIILGVIGLVFGIIVAIPLLVIVVPAALGLFMTGSSSSIAWTPLIIAGLCCVAYFPVLLVLGGIERSYIQSVWTLTYLRLTAPSPAAPAGALESADAA